MGEPLIAFIALAGSALLGFLFCASVTRLRIGKLAVQHAELSASILNAETEVERLKTVMDSKVMTIDNLQKISQDVENQAIEKDSHLKILQAENIKLRQEIQQLIENPIEKIKEIDVIREVPVLVLREINIPESRMEKAKKLMKAFTKGYLDENGLLHEAIKEEVADEED